MSVDKLVDSTQLDADLTSVANAIRTKGGTSASLAFPADFLTAIAAIPAGGGGVSTGTITPTARTTTMTIDIGISTLSGLLIVPTSETPLQSGGKTCIAVIVTPSNYFKFIAPGSNSAGSSWLTPSSSTANTYMTLNGTEATVTLPSSAGYFEDISYTWFAW